MSRFGQRMASAAQTWNDEFADDFIYTPMKEQVNGEPQLDTTRTGGAVRVIVLKPGVQLGSGWGLRSAHTRASGETTIYFYARGLLADVQKFDRFALAGPNSNPDQPQVYEIGDGPIPIGFGWYKSVVVELTLIDDQGNATSPLPTSDTPWVGSNPISDEIPY